MNNIGMFYFTGTQSSYFVSKMLKDELTRIGYNVKMFKLEKALNKTVNVDPKMFDMIGFVVPIYGFGAPRIVHEFIETLPRNHVKVFIIRTGASNSWVNHSASIGIINQLRKKWYEVFYERIVVISSNWLLDFEDEVTKRLYMVTRKKKIPHIAYEIDKGIKRRYHRNFIRDLIFGSIYFFEDKIGARVFGKSLWANRKCTKCHLCEKRCPVNNISFESGKFKTGWSCVWCMKCVYSCPENAIHSLGMDFVQFKSGYNYRWIVQNRNDSGRKLHVSKKMWRYMEDRTL